MQEINVSSENSPNYFPAASFNTGTAHVCGLRQTAGTTESAQLEHNANPDDESNKTAAWHSTSSKAAAIT